MRLLISPSANGSDEGEAHVERTSALAFEGHPARADPGLLPGGASLGQEAHAALLGLPVEIYAAELGRMQQEASEAAGALLADQAVASMVDRLPLRKGAKVVVFGDSLTSEPQSWAVILREMLARRRDSDGISLTVSAVAGETTTHGLVRAGRSQVPARLDLLPLRYERRPHARPAPHQDARPS